MWRTWFYTYNWCTNLTHDKTHTSYHCHICHIRHWSLYICVQCCNDTKEQSLSPSFQSLHFGICCWALSGLDQATHSLVEEQKGECTALRCAALRCAALRCAALRCAALRCAAALRCCAALLRCAAALRCCAALLRCAAALRCCAAALLRCAAALRFAAHRTAPHRIAQQSLTGAVFNGVDSRDGLDVGCHCSWLLDGYLSLK